MQRQDDAASAQGYVLCDQRQRGTDHGRIQIHPAEGVEVTLRCPDCRELILIRKACSFDQQSILVLHCCTLAAGEVEEGEIHRPRSCLAIRCERRERCMLSTVAVTLNHDSTATG